MKTCSECCELCIHQGESFRDRNGVFGYVCKKHKGHMAMFAAYCEDQEPDKEAVKAFALRMRASASAPSDDLKAFLRGARRFA